MMVRRWYSLLLVGSLLGAACGSSQPPSDATGGSVPAAPVTAGAAARPAASAIATAPAASAPQKLSIGVLGTTSDAPVFIALERGYFQEQGLDVDLVEFQSGSEQPAALATGQLDVGGGALSAGLYNAMARGLPVKIVADRTRTVAGYGSNVLAVRKDLIDSGQVRDISDLKGRPIGQPGTGSLGEVFLDLAMKKAGLAYTDVERVEMGYPDMVAAMGSGRLDAGIIIEPFVALGARRGILARWKGFDDIVPEYETAVEISGSSLADDLPRAQRFMVAYLKGARDYVNAVVQGVDKPSIVAILTKNTSVKDATLYDDMVLGYLNPDGYVGVDLVAQDIQWYREHGYLQEPTPLEARAIVDNRAVDAALGVLGPYAAPR
jgi:ABC-type nitrate/sulfonate/bicarbonate transport system substrate-binding protein